MRLQIVIEAINKTKGTLQQIQAQGNKIGQSIGQSIQQGVAKLDFTKALGAKLQTAIFTGVTNGLAKIKTLKTNFDIPGLTSNLSKKIVAGVQEGISKAQSLLGKLKLPKPTGAGGGQPGAGGGGSPLNIPSLIKGAGAAVKAFGQIGLAIQGVQMLFGTAQQAAMSFYGAFIGRAVELEQQLLSTKATLVATNAVMVGGERVTDPTAAIKALGAPIDAALASVREQSLELVGVTSGQLVPIFQNIAGQSASIGANLQDSADLTVDFAAALGTLSIPLEQQRQEVSSILMANISSDSTLAKSLNITNEMVKSWKSQGRLVEELNKKLEAFRAGNALAAQTISGVMSNIQEIYEIITMEVGQQFIAPIVEELNKIYEWLSSNRELIKEYVSNFAEGLFTIGKAVWDLVGALLKALGPALKSVLDAFMVALDVITDVADGISQITDNEAAMKGFANSILPITATIQVLAKTITAVGKAWQWTMGQISGANAAKADALADMETSFDGVAARANKYAQQLRDLEEAEKIQGELTEEQIAERDKLVKQMGSEAAYIDELIASYSELDLGPKGEEMIKLLTEYRNNLADTKLALLPIDDKGTFLYQQNLQLEQYLETLRNEAGDPAQFDAALQGIADVSTQLVEAGKMSRDQAIQYLRDVASNTKASGETQQKAQTQLLKLLEEQDDSRQESIKNRIAEIENLRKSGDMTELEGIEEIGQLKIEGLNEELTVAEEVHAEKMRMIQEELDANIEKYQLQLNAMRAQLANDTSLSEGDKAELTRQIEATEAKITEAREVAARQRQSADRKLNEETARINSEVAATELENAQQINDQKMKDLEMTQSEELMRLQNGHRDKQVALEEAVLTGQKTEREANEEKLAMQEEQMQLEYKHLLDKQALLQSVPLSDDPETRAQQLTQLNQVEQSLADKRLEIYQHQADKERRVREQAMEDLENEIAKSMAIQEEAQLNREIELEKLVQARVILEEDANAEIANLTVERTKQELAAEQQKLALLRTQVPRTVEERKQWERQIQEAEITTSQLTLQLLQNEKAAQQAAAQAVMAAIDKELAARRNLDTERTQLLERQVQSFDFQIKALDNIIKLEEQRKSLVQSTTNFIKSQYDIAIGLADSEEEANKLREESLKAQMAMQKLEHEIQRQALELDIERNKILLEREAIQNRIAQINAEAGIAQADAELAKVKADPTASPEEVRAAELNAEAARMTRDATVMEGQYINQQFQMEAQSANVQRTQLAQQQTTENMQLRSEYAQQTGNVEMQQQIQNEALRNARNTNVPQAVDRVLGDTPATPDTAPTREEYEERIRSLNGNPATPTREEYEAKIRELQQPPADPRGINPNMMAAAPILHEIAVSFDPAYSEHFDKLLAATETIASLQVKEVSPVINNYFQGDVDKKMLDDSQQKFLQQFDQVLKLAAQAS